MCFAFITILLHAVKLHSHPEEEQPLEDRSSRTSARP